MSKVKGYVCSQSVKPDERGPSFGVYNIKLGLPKVLLAKIALVSAFFISGK